MKTTGISVSVTVPNHESSADSVLFGADLPSMSDSEIVCRIINLNEGLCRFWSNSSGWAPIEAAELLSKSRLDWQVQLSKTLQIWIEPTDPECSDGRLILAWTNLGSLLEGTLKLFLSVWYQSYVDDIESIKKKGKLQSPDSLQLEPIRAFFKKQIWDDGFDKIALNIQTKRNAIHAFKNKDIGTWKEFSKAVRDYLFILRYINSRLPYPDDVYIPIEL